jgi:soluble lytic murein transglycosylase-like protein
MFWPNKQSFSLAFFVAFLSFPATSFAFCFEEAGNAYRISPDLLRAISKVESGGNPRAINKNKNSSYDFGVMQINSSWAKTLGLEQWSRLGDPCTNVKTGAWILAQSMDRHGYSWEAVGYYNAKAPKKRALYIRRVANVLEKMRN